MYFLRPSASTSSWIVKTRPYIFSIGNHYFFA
jgi:spore germination cell wall hydrolase CwlJ-like protein